MRHTFSGNHKWTSHLLTGMMIGSALLLFPSIIPAIQTHVSRGQSLSATTLVGAEGLGVDLEKLKGRVKLMSMVPQLNTPVCDEQTHRFSEHHGRLDQHLQMVTISTNTFDDQQRFTQNANIHNITFLSDSPALEFGRKTGLQHPTHHLLQRSIMVVDEQNIIRYIEIVPMSQLPDFEAALEAARRVPALPVEEVRS